LLVLFLVYLFSPLYEKSFYAAGWEKQYVWYKETLANAPNTPVIVERSGRHKFPSDVRCVARSIIDGNAKPGQIRNTCFAQGPDYGDLVVATVGANGGRPVTGACFVAAGQTLGLKAPVLTMQTCDGTTNDGQADENTKMDGKLDGVVRIENVPPGTYRLTETKPPTGKSKASADQFHNLDVGTEGTDVAISLTYP
jgi:hypothetical protein